jgi:LuxR family maltose regulon positive regulatory protein
MLLKRPRVTALIERAIRSPFVTVISGPGYGKTCEMASFAKDAQVRLVWMHFSLLDNFLEHFWNNFVLAVSEELPNVAKQFDSIGFPDNLSKFEWFIQLFAGEIYSGEQVLFVADNFEHITSDEVKFFFESLIKARLENFCLTLISSARTDIGIAALGSGLYQITSDDLKFTRDETRELFAAQGHELAPDKLLELDRLIGGWPVALHLISQNFDPDRMYGVPEAKLDVIGAMFEREFFSGYSPEIQRLLVKLSLLQSFPFEIVRNIGCDTDEAVSVLAENIHVARDYSSRLYTLQKMYRAFLASKAPALGDEETREFWRVSGETFLSLGRSLEAIECFENCGEYEKMFKSITEYSRSTIAYSRERANYFLRKFELLPAEFMERNPYAEYMKAMMLINNLEIDSAYEIIVSLEKKLADAGTREERELLGDVYWLMGSLNMLNCDTRFVEYFRRCAECFPNGSPVRASFLHVGNIFVFNPGSSRAGEIERMERAMHEAMPYFTKVARGGGSGLEHLFSAEAGYFTFDFNKAKQSANMAIHTASAAGQHDILCNAYVILAKTALMQGSYDEARGHIDFVSDYINERELTMLYDLRDCALSGMYVYVGDFDRVARWITSPAVINQTQSPIFRGRDHLIHAEYLLGTQKYDELLALLKYIEAFYKLQGRWVCVLKCLILHALAHLKTGDAESARSAFRSACDMARENYVITPFVECSGLMRGLVEAARGPEHGFDPVWLDDIHRKSSTFAKRQSLITKEHLEREGVPYSGQKLSKRESELLRNLSQGLTREEIADVNSLSINTVKRVIKNVYNKLGAVNRADAVRIATARGILK